jgi:polyisoprenoid-binding protein YceI
MSRPILSLLAAALALGTFGCVQRAVLLPVLVPKLTELAADATRSRGPGALSDRPAPEDGGAAVPQAQRFVIRQEGSKLEVSGGDLLTGKHVMRFRRWRGAFLRDAASPAERPSGRLTLDIDLTSLDTDWVVDDSLRNHLLEVGRFPRARFAGAVRPRDDGQGGHVFVGRLVVHGVERSIRFYLDVKKVGGNYQLDSEFDMSRDAFDMHRKDAIDLVIYDDFRVVLGLVAHPEKVSVETLVAE